MAKLYFVRHQSAGIIHEHPFTERPSNQQLEDLVVMLSKQHGTNHPKTGSPYWSKLIAVDTAKPADDPTRVETVGGVELVVDSTKPVEHPDHIVAHVCSADHVDRKASGYCPIREGDLVPDRGARESLTISAADFGEISVSAAGTVKNPE